MISSFKVSSFVTILVKESFIISLKIDEALFNSLKIFVGVFVFGIRLHIVFQRSNKFSKSRSNSATFLPSATVLRIIPNPFGLILLANFFSLSFSFGSAIRDETEIRLEKGTSTIYLPAIESSELNRGPLDEIGSFTI